MKSRLAGLRPALAMMALLTGCLPSLPPRPEQAPVPVFDPVAFFAGHTHGEGTLRQRFGRDRTLTVGSTGAISADSVLILDQVITYDDHTVENRRWVVRRSDATHYAATLSDADGPVTAESSGSTFHLRYHIRSPRVFMEQWLVLQPDGRSLLNQAEVTVLGIPWFHLSETITRS